MCFKPGSSRKQLCCRAEHEHSLLDLQDSDDEAVMDRLVWRPQAVTALKGIQIKQVRAAFLRAAGCSPPPAWSWAAQSACQLALSGCSLLCTHLQSTLPAEQVACGDDHTLALSRDGSLFAFGDNSLGQLGSKRSSGTASSDVLRWLVRNEHQQLLRCRQVCHTSRDLQGL